MTAVQIDPASSPRRNPDVRYRRLNERLVLVSGAQVYELNETAERAWSLCDGASTFEQIIDEVAREFDVDRETVRGDLAELFTELEAMGVLTLDG